MEEKCAVCSQMSLKDFFIKKDDKWVISGEVAFHFYDTHGIPVEIFEYAVNEIIYKRLGGENESSGLRDSVSC